MRGPTATTRTPGRRGARRAPLAQRQVGHLVAVGGEPLGEVAVPALGAADGVGEEAVVDEADAHRAAEHSTVIPRRVATRAPSSHAAPSSHSFPSTAGDSSPSAAEAADPVKVSVVIPASTRRRSSSAASAGARARSPSTAWHGEVIVADNGSEDGSAELAARAGARVVHEPRRGYGSAYLAGFAAAARRLHRHGRRRPDLRLRRDPALRRASSTTAPTS